jgi:uncharacterized membrane protein YadS
MLLGASLSLAAIAASGPLLLMAVVATVAVALAFSYGVSRMLGLSIRMSIRLPVVTQSAAIPRSRL